MKLTKLHQNNYRMSTWSGGETTEIYLFPVHGTYEIGKFDFRVSTASVQLETTDFTVLPGYKRLIMSLDKPLELNHLYDQQREEVFLAPFESHFFLGKEQTKSIGKCTDFNLIFKEELTGELQAYKDQQSLSISSNQKYIIFALKELTVDFYQGVAKVKSCHLYHNDAIVLEKVAKGYQLVIVGQERTEIPIAVVASVV